MGFGVVSCVACRFLRSWHDALAGTKCYSGSMCLTDLDGTGEHRLLCATEDKRLRVYSGMIRAIAVDRVIGN